MEPLNYDPDGDAALVNAPDLEIQFDEDSAGYQKFVGRLESDLAAMVDRWLHVSAPCAARGGLGKAPGPKRS